jgi:hypothetical protein
LAEWAGYFLTPSRGGDLQDSNTLVGAAVRHVYGIWSIATFEGLSAYDEQLITVRAGSDIDGFKHLLAFGAVYALLGCKRPVWR